jgi:hypothetical protein
MYDSFFITRFTSFLTGGESSNTTGNAKIKARPQALSQIFNILLMKPTLKTLKTNDITPDINNAIKNANTRC